MDDTEKTSVLCECRLAVYLHVGGATCEGTGLLFSPRDGLTFAVHRHLVPAARWTRPKLKHLWVKIQMKMMKRR